MVTNIVEDPDQHKVVHFELTQGFAWPGSQGQSFRQAQGGACLEHRCAHGVPVHLKICQFETVNTVCL